MVAFYIVRAHSGEFIPELVVDNFLVNWWFFFFFCFFFGN